MMVCIYSQRSERAAAGLVSSAREAFNEDIYVKLVKHSGAVTIYESRRAVSVKILTTSANVQKQDLAAGSINAM